MKPWKFPNISSTTFEGGDMPGDKICIDKSHIKRAEVIIPFLKSWIDKNRSEKIVLSVFGGSGVGKSEIGSLLKYYLEDIGLNTYLLSGDNYPFRIPKDNDKERLRIFRYGVLQSLTLSKDFSSSKMEILKNIWEDGDDFTKYGDSWNTHKNFGTRELNKYLSTNNEIDFSLLNKIINDFKEQKDSITLKKMGREMNSLTMEKIDFTSKKVLIVEWTHGNNPLLKGIDYPIFLYSTPEETLKHRLNRARDKEADSPFVSLVLNIEQKILKQQTNTASLIISLDGEVLNKENIND